MSEYVTIPKEYVKSENRLILTLKSGNRNIMGPFHYGLATEPESVFPDCFTLKGTWENGESSEYRSSYAFVPFGIRKIEFV